MQLHVVLLPVCHTVKTGKAGLRIGEGWTWGFSLFFLLRLHSVIGGSLKDRCAEGIFCSQICHLLGVIFQTLFPPLLSFSIGPLEDCGLTILVWRRGLIRRHFGAHFVFCGGQRADSRMTIPVMSEHKEHADAQGHCV